MKEAPVLAATALVATAAAVAAITVAVVTAAVVVVVLATAAAAAATVAGFGEFINELEVVMMVGHGFCETIVVMVVVVVTTAPGRTAMAVLAIVVVVMPICELLLLLCVAAAERIIIITEKWQWSENKTDKQRALSEWVCTWQSDTWREFQYQINQFLFSTWTHTNGRGMGKSFFRNQNSQTKANRKESKDSGK